MTFISDYDALGISFVIGETKPDMANRFFKIVNQVFTDLGSCAGKGVICTCSDETRRGWEQCIRLIGPDCELRGGRYYKDAKVVCYHSKPADLSSIYFSINDEVVAIRNIKIS